MVAFTARNNNTSECLFRPFNRNQTTLEFPGSVQISREAKDLIRKLLCPQVCGSFVSCEEPVSFLLTPLPSLPPPLPLPIHQSTRLGSVGGAKEIKQHPFFLGIDWASLRESKPPFVPELASATDLAFFDTDEFDNHAAANSSASPMTLQRGSSFPSAFLRKDASPSSRQKQVGCNLPFAGYYYACPRCVREGEGGRGGIGQFLACCLYFDRHASSPCTRVQLFSLPAVGTRRRTWSRARTRQPRARRPSSVGA